MDVFNDYGDSVAIAFLASKGPMIEASKKGFDAYERSDFKATIAELTPLSDDGNFYAQLLLGYIYLCGFGVEVDSKKAFKLLSDPAYYGVNIAQIFLGIMHSKGDGVEQNYGKAFDWFKLAAESGYSEGYFLLGQMYLDGEGVDQNFKEARKCFIMAREKGHPEAQKFLNKMDDKGMGRRIMSGSVDYAREYADLLSSPDVGNDGFYGTTNVFVYCGDNIDKWISLAEAGYVEAQFYSGMRYFNGESVERDYEKALKWFHLAANMDSGSAQFFLGMMYAKGIGVSQDIHIAYLWFDLAASNEDFASIAQRDIVAKLPDFDRDKLKEADIRRLEHSNKYCEEAR